MLTVVWTDSDTDKAHTSCFALSVLCISHKSQPSFCFPFLWWYLATVLLTVFLCIVYTILLTLHSTSDEKTFSCTRLKSNGFGLWLSVVLFHQVSASGVPCLVTTFLITSDTAVFSHSSQLLLKPFWVSLYFSLLWYPNTATGMTLDAVPSLKINK